MTPLTMPERVRLARICDRLASPHPGEVVAAATLAVAFLARAGLSWDDVLHAAPAPVVVVPADRSWRACAEELMQDHNAALNDWEAKFLASVLSKGFALSEKQDAVLRRLANKCGVAAWQV